jgi:hypothetical protein
MRRILPVPLLLAVLAGATACSAPSRPGVAAANGAAASASASPASRDDRAQLRHFAQCMRQHGQNVPDPDAQGNMTVAPPPGGDAAAWNTAMQACEHFMPQQEAGGGISPQQLAADRAFAVCLRQHGIDLSDPDPSTGKSEFEGRLAHASRAQIANDPQVKAAQNACRDKLSGPGADSGGGKGK